MALFSKWMGFTRGPPPLHSEWDSLQRIPLLNSEWDSHQVGHPLQENGIRTKRVTLSKANGIRIKRVTLSKANEIRTKGSPSPSEWDSHQEGHPLQSEWDSLLTSGVVAARDPFQGILLQGHATQGIPFPKGFASASKRMVFASRDSHSPKQQRLSRGTRILLDDAFIPSFVS